MQQGRNSHLDITHKTQQLLPPKVTAAQIIISNQNTLNVFMDLFKDEHGKQDALTIFQFCVKG